MDIRQLCLFCLSFLSALGVYAQAEQKDSTVQDNKGVLITLTDGIATTVRHTGRNQSLSSIRSITQLVGVALMPSQVQTAFPCKCSTTAFMSGSCT